MQLNTGEHGLKSPNIAGVALFLEDTYLGDNFSSSSLLYILFSLVKAETSLWFPSAEVSSSVLDVIYSPHGFLLFSLYVPQHH